MKVIQNSTLLTGEVIRALQNREVFTLWQFVFASETTEKQNVCLLHINHHLSTVCKRVPSAFCANSLGLPAKDQEVIRCNCMCIAADVQDFLHCGYFW